MASTRRSVAAAGIVALFGALSMTLATAQVAVKETSASSAVSAVSWGPGPHIRVYRSDGEHVTETGWDGKGPWYEGGFTVPGQSVSATAWTDDAVHIRVYVVNHGSLTEYCWDANGPWYRGSHKP